MKQVRETREEDDVWTAIRRTTNRKCTFADVPAVVSDLAAVSVQSKQQESLQRQLFKCQALKIVCLRSRSFPTVSNWPIIWIVCLYASFRGHFTVRETDRKHAAQCVCVFVRVCLCEDVLSQWLMAVRY